MGYQVLLDNTSGTMNMAGGYSALKLNTTGNNNTAFGYQTLLSNTTTSNNTAFGYQALTLATASDNVAFGYQALNTLTTGSNNTAIGYAVGTSITTGSNNTILGQSIAGSSALSGAVLIGTGDGTVRIDYNNTVSSGVGLLGAVVLVGNGGTVSGLPAASSALKGARTWVTDATATTFYSTVAGGGSNVVPVFCNGTNWVIG
jgi:hypothetical protein